MALSGRDFVGIAQTGSGKTLGVRLDLVIKIVLIFCCIISVHASSYCTH